MDRLHRTRMLLGDSGVERLRNSTVMVVGVGAVGSFAVESLARSGIGHLILVDADVVEESNINRQLFALDSTVGQPKVDVAAARIHDINPDIRVDALRLFFDEKTNLDCRPDYIIDAIDTTESKVALARWAQNAGIPMVSSMGAARKTDISRICVGPLSKTTVCPLAARMRRLVRDAGLADFDVVYSTQPAIAATAAGRTFGSLITVTGAFGLTLANYVIMNLSDS
ncbi:MAG: tRNA threonylcarbamoyladenosine dehydratase [Alphaproteobacteria bacterium]|nr:tRNA threonylcarbamoyladenosine dehydratase [Alphaproteobacteria bacterium]